MRQFELRFNQELYHEAIKVFFKTEGPSNAAKDTVTDLFDKYAYDSILSAEAIAQFTTLFKNDTITHPYAQQWLRITKRYYIATNMEDTIGLVNVQTEIYKLIARGRYYLNPLCIL